MTRNDKDPRTEIASSPSRAVKLLGKSWAMMQESESRYLDRKTFAEYCGLSETTYSNWVTGTTELNQIEAILRAMERIPVRHRQQLFTGLLRDFPTLESSQIAHDPTIVNHLRRLAHLNDGLTIVYAERNYVSSFVFTAIAREASRVGTSVRKIRGLDFASAQAFVPVPGIIYAEPTVRSEHRTELAKVLRSAPLPLTIVALNGALSRLPELQKELLPPSARQHLIIGESGNFDLLAIQKIMAGSSACSNLVKVRELAPDRFGITCETL
jgi:hypothetical protein